MARQPLATKHPKSGFAVGHGASNLRKRPMAAALIAECLAGWSEVEFQIGRLLATMLHANSEPTIALYFTLANERAKREALAAIADYCLTPKDRELFDLIAKAKDSLSKQRSDLAHGLFCLVDDEPEGIGWISTKDRIKYLSDVNLNIKERGMMTNAFFMRKLVSVYGIKDLETLLNDIDVLQYLIINFNLYVSPGTDHHLDAELFDQLWNSPLVLKFRSQTDQKSAPSGS
jgi:hypothetical protein